MTKSIYSEAQELKQAKERLEFQMQDKVIHEAELAIAVKALRIQKKENAKRAAELVLADIELAHQQNEKSKRAAELLIANYALSVIEATLDPLFTINRHGVIIAVNDAMIEATEKTRKQLVGSNFKRYFVEKEKADSLFKEVFTKGKVMNCPLTITDGVLTDVLINASLYNDADGKQAGAVVVARNITDLKKIEKELTMAKEAAELAMNIAEEAQNKAEQATLAATHAVHAKQQFLSNMSHEIRTPMNAIIGFTKVILKTDLTEKQREYLNAIKISGDALIVLINDILDLAKVEAGKMEFEHIAFKMESSIAAMIHLFESKILEKNLELVKIYDQRIPQTLLGDPVRLHQIMLNLMSNAAKFTPSGKITVSVMMMNEDENQVSLEFAVEDTGIGIKEDKLKKIFDNFQQATSDTSRLFGGTGLGLAIVKQLVEPQGGTISVESAFGIGSRFSFQLNFQKTNEIALIDESLLQVNTEFKNIKILVVEDIPLNQLLMKTLLDDFGFERDIAENGLVAIEYLKRKSYDIILMDLQMPEMNGFEATEYIRNTLHSNVPIIALTADVTTVDLAKCKAVGMNDYIAKPIDDRMLYNKIINSVQKPLVVVPDEENTKKLQQYQNLKYIDLSYLNKRTKSDPNLMMEMITAYLEQTPVLVKTMKQSLIDNDWKTLQAAAHKMIPSFSIMGINSDFEGMAKKIQGFAQAQLNVNEIKEMVSQLELVCNNACDELVIEFNSIKEQLNDQRKD